MRALAAAMLCLAAVIAASAAAHETRTGSLVIEHAWARATTAVQKNGSVYMTIANHGGEPDRLVGARSSAAGSATLHVNTVTPEGVVQMRSVDTVDIAPGGEVRLAPGGLHIMLSGLSAPLAGDTKVPMTLVFERAGEVAVEVEVMAHGAQPSGHGDDSAAAGAAMDHGAHGTEAEGQHGAQHGN